MASRTYAAFGVALAALVGISTSYVTLQPELERQREEREGSFKEKHNQEEEHAISRAIISDLQEAKEQVTDTKGKGPLWGIREALFGKGQQQQVPQRKAEEAVAVQESPKT